MPYCLPSQLASEFLKKLKSGEINPSKLAEMGSSEERRKFFSGFLGEANAKQVNALFESKLLLKNQKQGFINWAKTFSGLKPKVRRDLISKAEKLTNVLDAKTKEEFLEDYISTALGTNVTMEEAGKISELSKMIKEKKQIMDSGGDRLDYGRSVVAFNNYISDLKLASKKKTILEEIKDPIGLLSKTAGLAKALKATLDNSALGRQGLKTMWTSPMIWKTNAIKSFKDMYHTFGGKNVMDELNSDIVSRPTYDLMKKAKLAVGVKEEAFPTSLPEKIPVLGRVFKASENAYAGFLQKTRADVFDKYLEIAKKSGVDISDKFQLESIGKLVNSLTGRGDLGRLEPVADIVNNVFFSPRNLKSNFDTLLMHPTDKMSGFARKQAAINLVKILSGTATVLAIANAVNPGSVEKDPRSADFGKIREKDTRFDVTGGMASMATLAARLLTMSTKSSTSGRVRPLNTGKFGAQTGMDVVYNFFENKLSPASSVVKDLLKGQDFSGNELSVLGELNNLFVPMPVNNFLELKNNPKSANLLLGMMADGLGISVNTYSKK